MKGKGIKLIIGIVLLIVAIVLYLLATLNSWLCLAVGVLGLIFIVLSFSKEEKKESAGPSLSSSPEEKEEIEVPEMPEEVSVGVGEPDQEKDSENFS
jgi:flagellar biosynthesis component FlhA